MSSTFSITCPSCHAQFALDETLAGPMIAAVRQEADRRIAAATAENQALTAKLKAEADNNLKRAQELDEKEASLAASIAKGVADARAKIAEEERENARKELAPELKAQEARMAELQEQLNRAQTAELALRKEKTDLDERVKALDLEVARKVDDQRKEIQEKAMQEADEKNKLKFADYDKIILDMRTKLAEADRKAAQKSQQLQGEVLEVDFEDKLRHDFPQDTIMPVKPGVRGGDILQSVMGEMGKPIGTIFWEFKRTLSWSNEWIVKAKKDATDAKAEVAMIVSENLPKGSSDFGVQDGVWFTRPACAVVLAVALRQGLVNTAEARKNATGKAAKAERLYEYMMGPDFRAMLEGIALPFLAMRTELAKERTTTTNRWKRQERRIEQVLLSVAGLRGDLQGIGGMELAQLPAFDDDDELIEDEYSDLEDDAK